MRLASYGNDVVAWAPAKVNLFLEALAKRPDGYHEIATLMMAIRLFDTLVFKEEPSGQIELECDSSDLSIGPDNLVWRAAHLLREHSGVSRGATIRLAKRIPIAAGLAGGSTDAAATLAGLNRLWHLGMTNAELAAVGAHLGSDIPFFFHTPAAWCTGRGEKVTAVSAGKIFDLVLVCPRFGLATRAVYQKVIVPPAPRKGDEIRSALEAGDTKTLGRLLFNRLQAAAESIEPKLETYRSLLESLRPAGQLMSGSGSSLFALCEDQRQAARVVQELRNGMDRDKFTVYRVRSCS